MGKLIIKGDRLELDGLLLQTGDHIELRLMGAFIPGVIARDQRGWFFLTRYEVGIRLQTGHLARLFQLASAHPL